MIGNETVSLFQQLGGTSGGTEIAAGDIAIAPSGNTANPQLTFSTMQATSRLILESLFTYRISGASFTGSTISLSNSTASGDGSVTDAQTLCEGGTFGPNGVSGCAANIDGLNAVLVGQPTDMASFGAVNFLSVTDDLTIDPGRMGTAAGATFTDRFTATPAVGAVPEPGSLSLLGVGAGFLIYLKKRFSATDLRSSKEEHL